MRCYLGVVLRDGTVFVPGDDVLAEVTPSGDCSLALIARNYQTPLVALLGVHIDFDIQHDDRPEEAHTFLRHRKQLCAILIELHSLHCGVEIPHFYAFACPDVP